ncbi:MAG: hypothetical protein ABJA79_06765 [Parafilimonas sp.]
MKTFILTLPLSLFITSAFSQTGTKDKNLQNVISIDVPDFTDLEVKAFYQDYADHLINCIQAMREKNESKVTALFKDPGEKLVNREKILAKELFKDPVEKQKYLAFAQQAYAYVKEVQQSTYYKKMYGK